MRPCCWDAVASRAVVHVRFLSESLPPRLLTSCFPLIPGGFAKADITGVTPSNALSGGAQPPTVFNFYFPSFRGAKMFDYSDAVNLVIFYGLFPILPIVLKSVRKQFCFLLGEFLTFEKPSGETIRELAPTRKFRSKPELLCWSRD